MRTLHALVPLAFLTALLAQPQEFPKGPSEQRTSQMRALGDPGPVRSKEERELLRKVWQQQKDWKKTYERDWKSYLKANKLKYELWTRALPNDRRRYQQDRLTRGLPPVPPGLMVPIHPRTN